MTEYQLNINPEDIFVKEKAVEYAAVIADYAEPLNKYHSVESLLEQYCFKDELEEIEIIHFIYENWFLASILKEAPSKIITLFGTGTTSMLEMFTDPEDESGTTKIFIVIRTTQGLDESLRIFDQLLGDWFDNLIPQTKGLLNITVESKDEF